MRDAPLIYRGRDGKEKECSVLHFFDRLAKGRFSVETPVRYADEAGFLPLKDHPELSEAIPQLEKELREREGTAFPYATLVSLLLPFIPFLFFFWMYPPLWRMFIPAIVIGAPLFLCPFAAGWKEITLLAFPYVNWITGPVVTFRRVRGAVKIAAMTGWAFLIALILTLWLLPETAPAFRPVIALLLFSLLLCCTITDFHLKRKQRKHLALIRRKTGFGFPPPWFKLTPPIARPLGRLRPFSLFRKGIVSMILAGFLLPIAVYTLVIYGVGTFQLLEMERRFLAAYYPLGRPEPRPEDREAAAIIDAMEFAATPESMESVLKYGPYLCQAEEIDPAYREAMKKYLAANAAALDRLPELLKLLPADFFTPDGELALERDEKYRILRNLVDGSYALGSRERYPEQVDVLRALRSIHSFLDLPGPAGLLERYLTEAPKEFLHRELVAWTIEEHQFPGRMRLRICLKQQEEYEDILTYTTSSFLRFYRPQMKANLLDYTLKSISELDEYYLNRKEWANRKELPFDLSITFFLLHTPGSDSTLLSQRLMLCRAVRTGIAAELFRRENGSFPDSLTRLIPDFLPEVPRDPFTGDPLLYHKGELEVTVHSIIRKGDGFEGIQQKVLRPGIRIFSASPDGKYCDFVLTEKP